MAQIRRQKWSDQPEWQGDFVAAGVSRISLWADNRAGNPLGLRLAFDGPGGWFYANSRGDILDAGTSANTLWIDNIAAVPEPSSLVLLLGAASILIRRRRTTV